MPSLGPNVWLPHSNPKYLIEMYIFITAFTGLTSKVWNPYHHCSLCPACHGLCPPLPLLYGPLTVHSTAILSFFWKSWAPSWLGPSHMLSPLSGTIFSPSFSLSHSSSLRSQSLSFTPCIQSCASLLEHTTLSPHLFVLGPSLDCELPESRTLSVFSIVSQPPSTVPSPEKELN